MNKPITMIIKETEKKLTDVCNESGLHPAILDLIAKNFYSGIHSFAERQAVEEEMSYAKMLEESSKNAEVKDEKCRLKK